MKLFGEQLAAYRKNPAACTKGEWVDAGFAADWYASSSRRDLNRDSLQAPVSAVRLGPVGLLFHPAELYSFYGLAIRHTAPFANTLVVGYTDGLVGYLADPAAYRAREYATVTVPKILDLPPFVPHAARRFTEAAGRLLAELA